MISYLLAVRHFIRIILLAVYAGCIVALSLLPPNDLPHVQLFAGFDKVVHFLMYFLFSVLLSWTLKTEVRSYRLVAVILASVAWGIMMEYMQRSMHLGRSFSWYDVLANCTGVISGVILYQLVAAKFARQMTGRH